MKFSTFETVKRMGASSDEYIHLKGEALKRCQQVLLTIAKDIASVCEENNIFYQLSGGSALGAIRHSGFIPWDDDMDINMLGCQYDKFVKCFSEKFGNKYWIHTYGTREYGMTLGKVRLKGSICRLREDADNEECGFCVDIFLLENVFDNRVARRMHGFLCMGLGGALSCRNFYKNRKIMKKLAEENPEVKTTFRLKITIGFLLSFMSVRNWAVLTQKCYSLCKNNNSEYLSIPGGRKHYFGEMYKREGMQETIMLPFEGEKFPVAKDYDDYLTKLYGNYMRVPPENEREAHILLELKFPDSEGDVSDTCLSRFYGDHMTSPNDQRDRHNIQGETVQKLTPPRSHNI